MDPAYDSYDYLLKIKLIGDSGVGKSCVLLRFAVSPACMFGQQHAAVLACMRPSALHAGVLPGAYRVLPGAYTD